MSKRHWPLRRAAAFLRGQLAREVKLRHVPTIGFEAETSFDYASHINDLLHDPAVARDLPNGFALDLRDGDDEDDEDDDDDDEDNGNQVEYEEDDDPDEDDEDDDEVEYEVEPEDEEIPDRPGPAKPPSRH